VASVFGIGYLPWAPGTVASMAAVGVWWTWRPSPWVEWVVAGLLALAGLWAAGKECRRCGLEDPQTVVVDEVAGVWLALAGHPKLAWVALLGVALFRLLDILKPPPIRQMESFPGGWGVMLDDVVAGAIVWVVLLIVVHVVTT